MNDHFVHKSELSGHILGLDPESQVGMKKYTCTSCGSHLFEVVACFGVYINEIRKNEVSTVYKEMRLRCADCAKIIRAEDLQKPQKEQST